MYTYTLSDPETVANVLSSHSTTAAPLVWDVKVDVLISIFITLSWRTSEPYTKGESGASKRGLIDRTVLCEFRAHLLVKIY